MDFGHNLIDIEPSNNGKQFCSLTSLELTISFSDFLEIDVGTEWVYSVT